MQEDWFNHQWDAIIIGSGMGGLNCACELAFKGQKVLVLEKNNFIGGRCSSYEKEGYTVDYCVHAFGNGALGPLEIPIKHNQQKFTSPIIDWQTVTPAINYGDVSFHTYVPLNFLHPLNYFRTGWQLLSLRGISLREKLKIPKIWQSFQRLTEQEIADLQSISVKEYINRFSNSEFIHSLFTSTAEAYSAISYDKTAAGDYIAAYRETLAHGGGISYPKGGCGVISNVYRQIIEMNGGAVITSQPVDRILTEPCTADSVDAEFSQNRAIGVQLRNGNTLFSKNIISNVDWRGLSDQLLAPRSLPPQYYERIRNISPSVSAVVVHIALSKPLIKEKVIIHASPLSFDEIRVRKKEGTEMIDHGCIIPIISNIDPNLAPRGKQLIIAGVGADAEMPYHKESYYEYILKILRQFVPSNNNLKDSVEWVNIFGPKELDSLFGENGAVIAYAQQIGQVRQNRFDSRTPIQGLYHCGDDSGINLVGIGTELAALSGQNCAKLVFSDIIQKKEDSEIRKSL